MLGSIIGQASIVGFKLFIVLSNTPPSSHPLQQGHQLSVFIKVIKETSSSRPKLNYLQVNILKSAYVDTQLFNKFMSTHFTWKQL